MPGPGRTGANSNTVKSRLQALGLHKLISGFGWAYKQGTYTQWGGRGVLNQY